MTFRKGQIKVMVLTSAALECAVAHSGSIGQLVRLVFTFSLLCCFLDVFVVFWLVDPLNSELGNDHYNACACVDSLAHAHCSGIIEQALNIFAMAHVPAGQIVILGSWTTHTKGEGSEPDSAKVFVTTHSCSRRAGTRVIYIGLYTVQGFVKAS